jgi:hypothetical protein
LVFAGKAAADGKPAWDGFVMTRQRATYWVLVLLLLVVLLTFGPRPAIPTAALIAIYIAYDQITTRRRVTAL